MIPYREPRSQKIQNRVPNQKLGTKPGISGLNFLGQPRSNWLYREDTLFLQKLTDFFGNLLVFTKQGLRWTRKLQQRTN